MIRRLQRSGQLYHISLPINWIKKNSLEKGSELDLVESNSDIVLKTGKNLPKRIELKIKTTEQESIVHLILGLFESGATNISILLENKLNIQQLKYIKKRLYEGYGFNMLEINENRIKISLTLQSNNLEESVKSLFISVINTGRAIISDDAEMVKIHSNQSQILRFSIKKLVNTNKEFYNWSFVAEFTGFIGKCLSMMDNDKKYKIFVEKTVDLLQKIQKNIKILDALMDVYTELLKLKEMSKTKDSRDYLMDRVYRCFTIILRELFKLNTNQFF